MRKNALRRRHRFPEDYGELLELSHDGDIGHRRRMIEAHGAEFLGTQGSEAVCVVERWIGFPSAGTGRDSVTRSV